MQMCYREDKTWNYKEIFCPHWDVWDTLLNLKSSRSFFLPLGTGFKHLRTASIGNNSENPQ
jgi:hypothetical protein